jgi:hypothetical protein
MDLLELGKCTIELTMFRAVTLANGTLYEPLGIVNVNDDLCSILTQNMEVANFTVEKHLPENHRWAVN